MSTGALEAADNEGELAGVLGHEIGHVVARHSVHQMKKAMMTNMGLGALGMLLGNKSGLAAMMTKIGAQLGANAAMMKFSRDDERQADQLGLQNLYAAGYNPDGMLTFFEKLEKQNKSNLFRAPESGRAGRKCLQTNEGTSQTFQRNRLF